MAPPLMLLGASAALSAGGTAMSVMGSLKQGKAQNKLAKFQARQLEQQAGQTEAAGQQAALEQRRQAEILQSRALAIAGASGGGTLDPTVLKVISGLAVEGERAVQSEIYNSKSQAQAQRLQASATRYEGYQAKQASKIQAFSTALSGMADMGSMAYFGMSTPKGGSGSTPSYIDFQRGINRGGFN